MGGAYDEIIDVIVGKGTSPEGGCVVNSDPPTFDLNVFDSDGDESSDNCFVLEGGEFKKLKLKELRRCKCQWAMQGLPLGIGGCKLSFLPIENEVTGEIDAWDCNAHAWDYKKRQWVSFQEDFGKNFDALFGLKEGEGQKMEDILMQRNNPETGKSFSLVFLMPLR